jgi:hypothetical protein
MISVLFLNKAEKKVTPADQIKVPTNTQGTTPR